MKALTVIALLALTNLAAPTWAADPSMSHDMGKMEMNPSKEDREKMAVAHTQMATCLRTDQDFKVCHEALHNECKFMMGESCSMMDMGKGMHKGAKHKK